MFDSSTLKNIIDKVPGLRKQDKENCFEYLTTTSVDQMVNDLTYLPGKITEKVSAGVIAQIANFIFGSTSRGISKQQFVNKLDSAGGIWTKLLNISGLRRLVIDAFMELPEEGHNVNRLTTIKGKNLTRSQSYYINSAVNLIYDCRKMLYKMMDNSIQEYNNFRSTFIRKFSSQYPKIDIEYFLRQVQFTPYKTYSGTPMDRVGQSYDWLGMMGLGDIYPGLNAEKKGNGVHPLIWALYDNLKAAEKTQETKVKTTKKAKARAAANKRARERANAVSQGAKTGWSTHLRF